LKTIWGIATTLGTPVRTRSATGQLVGYAVEEYAPEMLRTDIDCDHDESLRIGEVAYAEITPQNQLAIVGVVEADWLDELGERDLFLSGTYFPDATPDRRRSFIVPRATVAGMSLTFGPANIAARPVSWISGDLRESGDRRQWPISWRTNAPLVARAVDHLGTGTRNRSARIVDRRCDAGSDFPWEQLPARVRRAIGDRGREQAMGGLRHSAHAGCILSVR
jgi:hypothetical protein